MMFTFPNATPVTEGCADGVVAPAAKVMVLGMVAMAESLLLSVTVCWALYTVGPGLIHMDGDLALWYARSRKRSSGSGNSVCSNSCVVFPLASSRLYP